MRLHDEDSDQSRNRITIFLTRPEAEELRDALVDLCASPRGEHVHVTSGDFQKEVTVCLYNEADLDGLHERAKELIRFDR